jgi:hypothetical protein
MISEEAGLMLGCRLGKEMEVHKEEAKLSLGSSYTSTCGNLRHRSVIPEPAGIERNEVD